MRSPGVTYRRYRQQVRKILNEQIISEKLKNHKNCLFGTTVLLNKDGKNVEIPICFYTEKDISPFEDNRPAEICKCIYDCKKCDCDRFQYKQEDPKNYVKERLSKEINNPHICEKKYPELYAYRWVLDKELTESMKEPNVIQKIFVWLIYFLEEIVKCLDNNNKEIGPL